MPEKLTFKLVLIYKYTNLAQLVWTTHKIYKVQGLNPDHHKKKKKNFGFKGIYNLTDVKENNG